MPSPPEAGKANNNFFLEDIKNFLIFMSPGDIIDRLDV